MLKIALILSVVIAIALSECLSPAPVKHFRKDLFSGSWRLHTVVGTPIITDIIPPCVAYNFSGSEKYKIDISWVELDQVKSRPAVESSSQGGSLVITDSSGILVKLVVLDTDYKNYASLYFCSEANSTRSTVEIFLRSEERNDELIERKLVEAQRIVPILEPRVNAQQVHCIN